MRSKFARVFNEFVDGVECEALAVLISFDWKEWILKEGPRVPLRVVVLEPDGPRKPVRPFLGFFSPMTKSKVKPTHQWRETDL